MSLSGHDGSRGGINEYRGNKAEQKSNGSATKEGEAAREQT